ncbi:MAG: hypothetical protein HY744_08545 [Deltaproteobacteria bacterium]|nr:hypothetical protein [Deltaproteobacteria bacterium]
MARPVTVGILGRRREAEVPALEAALRARGAQVMVVDFHGFPRHNLATLGPSPRFDDVLRPGVLALERCDLWVLRTLCSDLPAPGACRSPADLGGYCRAEIARLAFQRSLIEQLAARVPVINPPRAFRFHREKAFQHQMLVRHGLATPRALATSDLARARAFVAELGGRAVVKPLGGGAEVVMADDAFFGGHGAGRGLRRPFLFQQLVAGRSLRAYTLGGRVVSAGEIHHDRRAIDWRERTRRVSACELPAALCAELGRAVRVLGLAYCGVDLEWDERTERHYLLDLNPAALFVGWSRLAGVDLAGCLASFLLDVVERGGDPFTVAGPRSW